MDFDRLFGFFTVFESIAGHVDFPVGETLQIAFEVLWTGEGCGWIISFRVGVIESQILRRVGQCVLHS